MRTVGLFALLIALFAAPVLAQDELPACDTNQREETLSILREADFANSYSEITDAMKDMDIAGGDLLDVIEDLDDFQVEWWSEIAAEFPECLESQTLARLGGRMLDELLTASLFGQLSFTLRVGGETRDADHMQDRFEAHLETYTESQRLFIDALTEMSESV